MKIDWPNILTPKYRLENIVTTINAFIFRNIYAAQKAFSNVRPPHTHSNGKPYSGLCAGGNGKTNAFQRNTTKHRQTNTHTIKNKYTTSQNKREKEIDKTTAYIIDNPCPSMLRDSLVFFFFILLCCISTFNRVIQQTIESKATTRKSFRFSFVPFFFSRLAVVPTRKIRKYENHILACLC